LVVKIFAAFLSFIYQVFSLHYPSDQMSSAKEIWLKPIV